MRGGLWDVIVETIEDPSPRFCEYGFGPSDYKSLALSTQVHSRSQSILSLKFTFRAIISAYIWFHLSFGSLKLIYLGFFPIVKGSKVVGVANVF